MSRPLVPGICQNARAFVSVLLCVLAMLASASFSRADDAKQSADKGSASAEGKLFDYRQTTLDNGLVVLTLEDFSCPIVNVQVWYHVGSKDENPERQGFAHMFEHMMFRGTERLGPTDHMDLIRQVGGECNAYTSFDQTVYHETLASHELQLALWLEAERMSALKIDQTSFDVERKVVEEERRVGLNRPFGTFSEKVMAEVFTQHPYRWTPIGRIPHLRSAAVSELRDFWTRYYVPNNATLVIAGAVKHAEAQEMAKRHFSWIPRGPNPPVVNTPEPPTEARTVTIKDMIAPAPVVGVLYRTVPLKDPDHTALELLTSIFVGDDSSRLYRSLVAEKRLAVQAIDISHALEQDGFFFAGAILPPPAAKPVEALAELNAQIEKLRSGPITEHELTKAKNQALKAAVVATLTVEGKASALASAAVLEGDPARANEQLENIRRVTVADLERVARKYLVPERQIVVNIAMTGRGGPGGGKNPEEDAPITAKPETQAPRAGRPGVKRPDSYFPNAPVAGPLDLEAPSFAHTTQTLDNGLKVLVIPNHETSLVSVQLGLLAGAWAEKKPGSASMALDMITKGTKLHDEAALADELGTYAISLGGSGGMDSATVNANCLTEQLDRTMGLLGEVVLTPTFPVDEFDPLKEQTISSLAVSTRNPAYQAQLALRRAMYGDHPYSRSAPGEPADVNALKLDDLTAWWKEFARPDMAVLIFAGDIDDARALALAKKTFGDWKADGKKPEIKVPEAPAATSTRILLVDDPESTQSQIRVGQLGITRHDPKYFFSRVVDSYFGGSLSSRLNTAIRVNKGLTYGANGGFHAQRFAGNFGVSTFSKTESTVEALEAVLTEVKRLKAEPPTADELRKSKAYLVGNFPLDRETPFQMAGELWLIETNGLPEGYFEQELQTVAKTGEPDCMQLIRDVVQPDKMTIVVVGKAEAVKAGLEKIAPVTVVKENK